MNKYLIRSTIILVVSFDFCLCLISAWLQYRNGYSGFMPLPAVFWAAAFLISSIIFGGHKKNNRWKGIYNGSIIMACCVCFLIISILITPFRGGWSFYLYKGKLFLLTTSLIALYCAYRHEKTSAREFVMKVYSYMREAGQYKLRSSFGRYLVSELTALLVISYLLHTVLPGY
ncbi:MAG: hypothetical protein JXA66_03945 [Oligoflexia bacterium]|nr:hypothetical protein [Oligoflexia bacterium]